MLLSLYEPAEDWLERATAALRNTPSPPAPTAPTAEQLAPRAKRRPKLPPPPRRGPKMHFLRRIRIPATVIAAVLLLVLLWPGSGSGAALAQALQNFVSARVLELAYANYEGEEQVAAGTVLVVDGQMERVEQDDRIVVTNHDEDRSLTLLPAERRAILSEAVTSWTGILDRLRSTLLEPAEELPGEHTLDGRRVRVYRLAQADGTLVSVRPGADLPVQIEHVLPPTAAGDPRRTVLRVVAAGDAFDPSRFSLTPPEGYAVVDDTGSTRAATARRLRHLGHALFVYANDHADTFPPDLAALAPYLDDQAALRNAGHGAGAFDTGFVYVPPAGPVEPQTVLAYQRFEKWSTGTHVLFGDGHVEFITNRDDLDALLARSVPADPSGE